MSVKSLVCIALLCAFAAHSAKAAPTLTLEELGPTPSGDRLWIAEVAPDPALLPGSMAVELAFAVDDAELLGVDVFSAVWDTPNPGFNPFTGTITDGLWVDLIGDRTFGAFGSLVLNSPNPVNLFLFETSGLAPTTIRYGVAASGSNSLGARIVQGGMIFDGYTGSVTAVPEPTSAVLAGLLLLGAMLPAVRHRRAA